MNGTFFVYKHTSPSGKVYIGITSQLVERRWRGGKGYPQNERLTNAIHKYGWDAFTHEILFSGLTKEQACEKEKELIARYDAYNPKKGYNKSLGGEHGRHSEQTRSRIGEAEKRLWGDAEYRDRMITAHKGRIPWNKGVVYTAEQKVNICSAAKARAADPSVREHMSEAARKIAATEAGHARLIQARAKQAEDPGYKEKMRELALGNTRRAKKVECIETGIVYASTKAAAASVGASRDSIGQVCRGIREISHGFHWRFADE